MLVQLLRHRRCSSAGTRSGARGSAARRAPPRSPPHPRAARVGRFVTSAGPVVHRPVDRPHLGELAQHVDEAAACRTSRRARSRAGRAPARCCALAHDEMPEVARCCSAWSYATSRSPRAHSRTALRIALPSSVVSQQSSISKHLVPATRLVEAERRPVLELRERVLELVAVVEDLVRRQDAPRAAAPRIRRSGAAHRRPDRASPRACAS